MSITNSSAAFVFTVSLLSERFHPPPPSSRQSFKVRGGPKRNKCERVRNRSEKLCQDQGDVCACTSATCLAPAVDSFAQLISSAHSYIIIHLLLCLGAFVARIAKNRCAFFNQRRPGAMIYAIAKTDLGYANQLDPFNYGRIEINQLVVIRTRFRDDEPRRSAISAPQEATRRKSAGKRFRPELCSWFDDT